MEDASQFRVSKGVKLGMVKGEKGEEGEKRVRRKNTPIAYEHSGKGSD